jgi:hypothetical protein
LGLARFDIEVNDGKTVRVLKGVEPQSQSGNKSAFKRKVTQKEYDETVTKKMEEFREMNQGRR